MYKHLTTVFKDLEMHGEQGRGLSISGSGYLANLLCPKGLIQQADFPDVSMLSLPYADNTFDFVVSDQVLEHVGGDPFKAVSETYRVLKPGGIVVHTTVLLFQIHGYPSDYWRFTPEGLRLLCNPFKEVIDCRGWGNRYMWALNWIGVLFDEKVPTAQWHPFHKLATINEERYPVTTWIVARK